MVAIKKVSDIDKHLKILVYGDPGVGKTTFAASASEDPDMADVLVANIEGGMLSIADAKVDATEQLKSVDELEQLFWSIANKKDGFAKYKTIIIDSVTELQTIDLEVALGDRDQLSIGDYGKSTTRLKRLLRQFRDLPVHVIATALVKRVMPDAGPNGQRKSEPLAVLPQLTSTLAQSLMGYMDFVWPLILKDGKRFLLTQETGPWKAKTRGPRFAEALGQYVENPQLPKILELLKQTEGSK